MGITIQCGAKLITTTVEYLVVAGGGGGGAGLYTLPATYGAGGGGAGGYLASSGVILNTYVEYGITVGTGGANCRGGGVDSGEGGSGTDSVIGGDLNIRAFGGGGGTVFIPGGSGGSGGGMSFPASEGGVAGTGYVGPPRQGYDGGFGFYGSSRYGGGGGGGAGGPGGDCPGAGSNIGGAAGIGLVNSITGSAVTYAAGGVGSGWEDSGATTNPGNTGKGGRGTGKYVVYSQPGADGVVVIKFPTPSNTAIRIITTGSPTVTSAGGYQIYKWISNGSLKIVI